MQLLVANILPQTPLLTLGVKIKTFLDHSHVAYQMKGNHECNNMVANILPTGPPHPDPGGWIKRSNLNFFRTCKLF